MQLIKVLAKLRKRSAVLFLSSIVFAVISLSMFNYEVWIKRSVATKQYSSAESKDLNFAVDNIPQNIRITSKVEWEFGKSEVKVPLHISIFWEGKILKKLVRFPRYGEAGGTRWGGRVSSYLNYGLIKVDKAGKYTLSITPGKEVNNLEDFKISVRGDAADVYFEIFSAIFLISLFLSIYYRETVFKNKYLAFLPYTLFALIALITVSCSVQS